MFRAPRRNRKRLSAGLANGFHRHFPARTDADVETARVQSHVGAQDARHLDVTDAVIDSVGVIDPVLLHQHTLHPEVRRHGGDLPRLIRLDATDRYQRVAALGERLGDQVLELAGLVAAESQAAVAILTLGVEIDLSAQMRAQALQGLDWCGAESQRMTGEALQVHGGCSWSSGRRACIVNFIVAGDHWNGTDVTGSVRGNSVLQCLYA